MEPDPISDQKLALVYPSLAHCWLAVRAVMWEKHGLQLRVTRGLSSFQNQLDIFMQGRKKTDKGWVVTDPKKVVTKAMGGQSWHNYGLALDSCFHGDDPYLEKYPKADERFLWDEYGRMSKKVELEWGGDWEGNLDDRTHIEMKYGLTIAKALVLFQKNGLKGVFAHCDNINNCGVEML